jgi:hypothetical protein
LGLKVEDNLTDYLSFKFLQERDKGKVKTMQPYLIDNLEKNFVEEVSKIQSYTISGPPRFKILRPKNELDVIEASFQSRFRLGVDLILYLIKHSRPLISNVVRELVKCMDGATLAAYQEMFKTYQVVLDTQLFSENRTKER